jgi:hypothetical protein
MEKIEELKKESKKITEIKAKSLDVDEHIRLNKIQGKLECKIYSLQNLKI